jgi:acetylornithine deacetylase
VTADIYVSIQTIPGEKSDDVMKQFEQTIKDAASGDEWLSQNPPEIKWMTRGEPWEQDVKHPLVQCFKSCIDRTVGIDVPYTGMSSGCDVGFAKNFGMQSFGTGGGGGNGHSPNEWVNLEAVIIMTKALALFIAEWCGTREH